MTKQEFKKVEDKIIKAIDFKQDKTELSKIIDGIGYDSFRGIEFKLTFDKHDKISFLTFKGNYYKVGIAVDRKSNKSLYINFRSPLTNTYDKIIFVVPVDFALFSHIIGLFFYLDKLYKELNN